MLRFIARTVGATTAALTLALANVAPAPSAPGGPSAAGASDAFVDAVGVDSHFNYTHTPYVDAWPVLSDALVRSGIRHIRDGAKPDADYVARLATLGRHGIRHGAGTSIHADAAEIRAHIAAYAPYLEYIEAPNEYDSQRNADPDWAAHLVAFQKFLYATVRADPANADLKVVGPPLAHQALYAELGALDEYEDAGNLHIATCDLNPGTTDAHKGNIAYTHALLRASTRQKPLWTTEVGYNDDMSRPCALGDQTIAKYVPRTLAEKWNAGEQRVYFYQYADMPTDKIFGGMGLMRADGSPKPQFTALTTLLRQLADPGAAFVPEPLAYRLGGDTRDVHATLLQKRDGRYELLLWLEVRSWDPVRREAIPVPPQTVTLSLPPEIKAATLFAYTPAWTFAASPLRVERGTAQVRVTDSIGVVELTR